MNMAKFCGYYMDKIVDMGKFCGYEILNYENFCWVGDVDS